VAAPPLPDQPVREGRYRPRSADLCSRKRRLHAVHRRNLLGHPGLRGHGAGGWHVLADGLESIATAVTATGTYSWQVSYDSTNAAQRDIPASCQETSSLTIANGGTVTSP